MRIQPTAAIVVISILLLAAAPSHANPIDYTFTNIADSTSGLSNFSAPVINNNGQVAFTTNIGGNISLWRADASQQRLLLAQGTIRGFGINDNGVVAYSQVVGAPAVGIYTSDGTTVMPVIQSKPNDVWEFNVDYGKLSINNNGSIAFTGGHTGGGTGIYAIQDGKASLLARQADYGNTLFAASQVPRINDNEQVVFRAPLLTAGPGSLRADGLLTASSDGSSLKTLVSPNDLPAGSLIDDLYSLNNKGEATFGIAQDFNSPFNYYLATTQGNGIKILIQAQYNTGAFGFDIVGGPGIDDNGEIVFDGYYIRNGQGRGGIFAGSDPQQDSVIAYGDPLLGSTLLGYALDPGGLNDKGQITFQYELANGQTGIALATPTNIPEPSFSGIVIALIALLTQRRSQFC